MTVRINAKVKSARVVIVMDDGTTYSLKFKPEPGDEVTAAVEVENHLRQIPDANGWLNYVSTGRITGDVSIRGPVKAKRVRPAKAQGSTDGV